MELEQRFWSKVDRTGGCWLWTSAASRDGYGVFGVYRARDRARLGLTTHNARAHRVAWTLAGGRPLRAGELILHACDTPLCVRPDHLRVGSARDNTRDSISKGRFYFFGQVPP